MISRAKQHFWDADLYLVTNLCENNANGWFSFLFPTDRQADIQAINKEEIENIHAFQQDTQKQYPRSKWNFSMWTLFSDNFYF